MVTVKIQIAMRSKEYDSSANQTFYQTARILNSYHLTCKKVQF